MSLVLREGEEGNREEEKKCIDQDIYIDNNNASSSLLQGQNITNNDDANSCTGSVSSSFSNNKVYTRAMIDNFKSQIEELEARNLFLQQHNSFLESENTELHKTVDELQHRFITLMDEKVALQTTMESLEHRFIDVPLSSNGSEKIDISSKSNSLFSRKNKNNETSALAATASESTSTPRKTSWVSGMLGVAHSPNCNKQLEEVQPEPSLPPLPLPPPNLPAPLPPSVNDSSQAEILKHTIEQKQKKRNERWSFSFVGGAGVGPMAGPNSDDNCKKEFEQFKRLSRLSDVMSTLDVADGETIKEEHILDHIQDDINDCEHSVASNEFDYGITLDDHDDHDLDEMIIPDLGSTSLRNSSTSSSNGITSVSSSSVGGERSSAWGRLFGNKERGGDTAGGEGGFHNYDSHDVIDKQRLATHGSGGSSTTRSSRQQEGTRLIAALLE